MANIEQDVRSLDIGTTFELTITEEGVAMDLSTSSIKTIKFKKPNGEVLTKTAAFVTDGTDGKLKYVTIENDLDSTGKWSVQAYVEIGSGKWHSTIGEFRVYSNIL